MGAIALGPSGNLQGGVRFFSLLTGKILHRDKENFTMMKMPADAIVRIQSLARRTETGLTFGDRNNITIMDSDSDSVNAPGVNDGNNNDDGPHLYDIQTEGVASTETEEQTEQQQEIGATNVTEDIEVADVTEEEQEEQDGLEVANLTGVLPENLEDEVPAPDEEDADLNEDDEEANEVTITRSGRISKPYTWPGDSNYTEQHTGDVHHIQPYYFDENFETVLGKGDSYHDNYFVEGIVEKEVYGTFQSKEKINKIETEEYQNYLEGMKWCDVQQDDVHGMMFAAKQLSVQRGLKEYKEAGKDSAMKEILNLTKNKCFGELNYDELTQDQKDKALPILMFMVLKRNGALKSRAVANGSVQRLYTDKEDVSSPTPDFYAFKYVAAVIGKEGRDVGTVDLPGFFLQTNQEEFIMLKLTGVIALMLVESDPEKWKKHLRQEDGKWVIYVLCDKAIYGTMNAALLAYKKLAKLFKSWGMTMNPYDPCVWNKIVKEKQLTILFHIDDILLSHMCANITTLYINKLQKEYGKMDALTVTRGKVHEYLGMTVDWRIAGLVNFSQYDGIKKLLKSLPDCMNGLKNTAAPEHLFKTDDESCPLDPSRKEQYHTITAKSLWFSQRSRPDTQLSTGFHCTRVKIPNEHDWKKLTHQMQYLRKTRFIPLIIGIDDEGNTMIYIDGAHAVHGDCKGHSGLFLTLGRGAMINVSKKLRLVTVSSTETEIVSTGERMPKATWFRYYRLAQGDKNNEDILMQDNKSTIRLQKHYPYSVGKGSKHINIRYYFVVDKVKQKEIKIIYCPTDEMIADYSTKPLQGAKFVEFRDKIQGVRAEDFNHYKKRYIEVLKGYNLFEEGDDVF